MYELENPMLNKLKYDTTEYTNWYNPYSLCPSKRNIIGVYINPVRIFMASDKYVRSTPAFF